MLKSERIRFCLTYTFLVFFLEIEVQGESEIVCIEKEGGERMVSLVCPGNKVLRVEESIYGRSQGASVKCFYLVGNCKKSKNSIISQCCGRKECHFKINKEYINNCGHSTFYRAIYKCVEEDDAECNEGVEWDSLDTTRTTIFGISTKGFQPQNVHSVQPSNIWSVGSADLSQPKKLNVNQSQSQSEELIMIVGSAVAVAFLLASIVLVIFLLRRYRWQGEKECILQIFIGLCKRQLADGSENPNVAPSRESYDQAVLGTPCNNANKTDDNSQQREIVNQSCASENEVVQNQNSEENSNIKLNKTVVNSSNKISSDLQNPTFPGAQPYLISNKQNDYVDFDNLAKDTYSYSDARTKTSYKNDVGQVVFNNKCIIINEPGTTAV